MDQVMYINCNITELKKDELNEISAMIFKDEIGKKYYPTEQIILNLLEEGHKFDRMYVAKNGTEIIGFIWFQEKGAFYIYPYLQMIYVKKEYRKFGVGRTLLDFFENASLNGSDYTKIKNKVFLCVGEWNLNAIKFYNKAGYTEIGVLPGLFRKRVNERLYMKECINKV